MNRRGFFKSAGSVAALAGLSRSAKAQTAEPLAVKENHLIEFMVRDQVISIETSTLRMRIEKGHVTMLENKITGESYTKGASPRAALSLLYEKEELVALSEDKFGHISTQAVSDCRAEIVFHNWDGDGVILVSVDPQNGDVLIEPSAYSSRPGVRACRWMIGSLSPEVELVAPFFQGIRLKLDDPLIKNSRWTWPMFWEAGLAILQGKNGGFWVHTRDSHYRYKALQVGGDDPFSLGFDSEAYGPIDENLSAGGLTWRINVFEGDWQKPATEYRDWLWAAYDLKKEEERRAPWIYDVRFAVSWCPTDEAVLDALAQKLPPQQVLLHIPNWRTDPYDENYPTFQASDKARDFIAKGKTMGFRMMPHFNAVDMDPSHPAYAYLRDFQYRDLESKKIQGWSWENGRILGVPESNAARGEHRDKKVMVKVHPGLSMWRSILGQAIGAAANDLSLETAFIDVTLTSFNLHNCFVEATTPTEGMRRLIDHVTRLGKGLVVGGEGLNEITMQGLSFAQAHLFKSWQTSIDGLERTGGCPLNDLLFGKLCRTIGYSSLSGKTEADELRMKIHAEHHAIPTVTIRSAREITNPNRAVKRLLELEKG
jgi:hypothetical protein